MEHEVKDRQKKTDLIHQWLNESDLVEAIRNLNEDFNEARIEFRNMMNELIDAVREQ